MIGEAVHETERLGFGGALPAIATRRLTLRPPRIEDADAFAEALSDYAVSSMLARVPSPYLRQDAVDWLKTMTDGIGEAGFAFAVTVAEVPVGVVGFDRKNDGIHIGYWLDRRYWRQGIMSEAVSAAITWYFGTEPEAVLNSGVFTDNRGSLALQNKLGFAITGLGEIFSVARNRSQSHIETMIDASRFTPLADQVLTIS
jgi:RimJ/RimL family protein N-acetyltransferase